MTENDYHWTDDALCTDSEIDFFSNDPDEKRRAKDLCMECPVRKICLQTALDNKEKYGIWGSNDEVELRKNQAVNAKGEAHKSTQGKIRCGYCGPLSTKYLKVLEHKRTRTHIECTNCGLQWWARTVINKKLTNF